MISVRDRGRPYRKHPSVVPSVAFSVTPSVALSIALSDSYPLPESEISKQPKGPSGPKTPTDISIPKYSEDDLQQILKAILEA